MSLVKGEAEVFPKPGKSFDPVLIPKAIQDAGFTATEVVVTADGTLAKEEEFLNLDVPGLNHPFVLAGGAQAEALRKRADLVGKNSCDRQAPPQPCGSTTGSDGGRIPTPATKRSRKKT